MEEAVPTESGWGREDVTGGEIMLKVAGMFENGVLEAEAGRVKDEDTILVPFGKGD